MKWFESECGCGSFNNTEVKRRRKIYGVEIHGVTFLYTLAHIVMQKQKSLAEIYQRYTTLHFQKWDP